MRTFFIVIFLFNTFSSFCQKDSLAYFFDKDFKSCRQDELKYIGFGIKENGIIKFSCYTEATGVLFMEGYFLDSTLSSKEGLFSFYDELGYKTSEGHYHNNNEEGLWLSWHHGHYTFDSSYYLSDSSYFENGTLLTEVSFVYHQNGMLSSRHFQDYTKKMKDNTSWNDNGSLRSKALWIDGTGDETFYYPGGAIESVLHSKNGKVSSQTFYNEDGTELTKKDLRNRQETFEKKVEEFQKKTEETQPSFPGGTAGFRDYMEHHIKFPESFLKQLQPGEVVKVSFTLNQDGFAYDIQVLEFKNPDLEEAILAAFKYAPAWNMKGYKKFGPLIYTINVSRF